MHHGQSSHPPDFHDAIQNALNRREFLKTLAGAGALAAMPGCGVLPSFDNGMTAATAILRADYDNQLVEVLASGFDLVPPPDVEGKRVVLKPNLVDLPRENKPIVTDPRVIVAVAEAFRRRGAVEVVVADGSALQRDTWQIVDAIGLTPLLREAGIPFVDLGTDDVVSVPNAGGATKLETLHLSKTAATAEVFVAVPKMKTHHWAGATLAMKGMYGIMPGHVYGWPRNIFHLRNLETGVMDFNLTRPIDYAIIDGIVGLEGDGPVRGTAKAAGVIVMGANATAVDATAARVMGLQPRSIGYLRQAAGLTGPIGEANIAQRGEPVAAVRTSFEVLQHQASLVI